MISWLKDNFWDVYVPQPVSTIDEPLDYSAEGERFLLRCYHFKLNTNVGMFLCYDDIGMRYL